MAAMQKVAVVRNEAGLVVAALQTTPQTLPNGAQVAPVFRLQPGQTSAIVEVPVGLKGVPLLDAAGKAQPLP